MANTGVINMPGWRTKQGKSILLDALSFYIFPNIRLELQRRREQLR